MGTPIQPQPGPQRTFLKTRADIAIYGGSAGGGKTFALLMEATRHTAHPGFGGVIFRRTYPQIMAEGGLWDESANIFPWAGGSPLVGSVEWRFRQYGTSISFRHLQHEANKYDWQGSQIPFLGFDEISHFSENQFWYMLSRNRSACGVRPYVRATTNPDPGWVKRFLSPWVDCEYDGPKAASGEVRWFLRRSGEIQWVPEGTPDAKSLTFVRASIYDNPALLRVNPEYLANLKSLPDVERARLLDGDWNVKREGLVYPGFEDCIVESHPDLLFDGGGIDFGFNNPFAGLWGFVDHDDVLWVIGCRYQRQCTVPIHAENIPRGPRYYADPAQPESIAQLKSLGHDVIACVHRPSRGSAGETRSPKLAGIDMVSERIRTGRLRIYRPGCLPLIRELSTYHYDPDKSSEEPVKEDDHSLDALRYYVVGIDRNRGPNKATQREIDRQYAAIEASREAREKAEAAAAEDGRLARIERLRANPWGDLADVDDDEE